jgi:glutamate dehydrogenase
MLLDIAGVVEHAAAWLLRAERLGMEAEASHFRPAVAGLAANISDLLPASERALMTSRCERLAAAGVPAGLAVRIAGVIFLITAFEIADLAALAGQPVERAARTFYDVGARFAFDELRAAARLLPAETVWQKAAAETLIDDFYAMQAEFAERSLRGDGNGDADTTRAAALASVEALAREFRAAKPDLAMLVVASRQLRQALG